MSLETRIQDIAAGRLGGSQPIVALHLFTLIAPDGRPSRFYVFTTFIQARIVAGEEALKSD